MASWNCPICTLSNADGARVCILCGNERGLVIPPDKLDFAAKGTPTGRRDYITFLYCEERGDPPALGDLEAESRTWVSIEGGQRPSMALLRAAATEKDALSLYISDWGFNGRPRGWFVRSGRLHYGRFVGSFPALYWLVSFLKESKSFLGGGGGGGVGGGGGIISAPSRVPSDEGEDITPTTRALRALYPDGWLRRERSGGGGGGGGGGGVTPSSLPTTTTTTRRISEEEEERLSRILLSKLAQEAEMESSSALRSHPSPDAICAVCYTDPATIVVCNGPTPHELCLPCTVNLVRSQIERGNDSIGCPVCPPPPQVTGPLGATKKPGLKSCVVRYEAVAQAQRDSAALVAAAGAAAARGGGGGGGSGVDLPQDFRALSEVEVQRFSTLCIINAARLEEEAVWVCPNEECRLPVWLEGSGSQGGGEVAVAGVIGWEAAPAHPVACRCSQRLCALCGGKWEEEHEGKTCAEWHRGKAVAAALDALRNGLKEGQLGKPCPNCGEAVFHARNHGCHHIAPAKGGNRRGGCPSCGTHWCYNCRALCAQPGHKMVCKCRIFCDKDCGCVECPECKPGKPCPSA